MKNPLSSKLTANLTTAKAGKAVEPKATRADNKDHVAITYKVDHRTHKRLTEARYERKLSLQGILDLAVDGWFKSIGEPGLEE